MEVLAESRATVIVNAPVETLNLTEWLFTLKDHEYKACSPSHIGSGSTYSKDGKRMSLNVEKIADTLLVQHYVEEISERKNCLVKSLSDSFSPLGQTKLSVSWEVKVNKLSGNKCELTNHVTVTATPQFLSLIHQAGITDMALVKAKMTENLQAHNSEETPLFAKDIEAKALSGRWP